MYMWLKRLFQSPETAQEKRWIAGDGGSTDDGVLGERMKMMLSKVDSKIFFLREVVMEYMEMKHWIDSIAEEKARMEQEAHRRAAMAPQELLEQLAVAREELASMKMELAAAKEERDEKDEKLKAVTVKVQELEAMKNQDEQLGVSIQYQSSKRKRSSVQEPEMLLQGVVGSNSLKAQQFDQELGCHHGGSDDDQLKLVREALIKEFMRIDCGGRKLGVKEMGRLDKKPFHAACATKLPPKEAEKVAYEVYTRWEKLLKDPSWKPFKKAVGGDNSQDEAIDVDDDMLQDLKREWGEGAHNAVVSVLMEMREYNCLSNRSIAYELWNYKEGRKATTMEGVEYLSNQVRQLSGIKRRKTRRTAGIA